MNSGEEFDDNCEIPATNENIQNAILCNLKTRFARKQIYTFNAKLLIAVNPYDSLPIYSNEIMQFYKTQLDQNLPPHVFCIGNDAIRAVKLKKKPQYIIITGESGSGKTVTTNHLTQYLSSDDMVDKAARIGKILDLFGNCETPLNYNSSRFVKILQLEDNDGFNINISYQLFEKSRLCLRDSSIGTNFHALYSLLQAPSDLKEELNLTCDKFDILPPRISEKSVWHTFNTLDEALGGLKSLSDMRQSIYRIIAAILHLGNVNFETDHLEYARINDEDGSRQSLEYSANFLAIDTINLESLLLEKKFKSRNDSTTIQFDKVLAARTRDSVIKHIYTELFRFIVEKCNIGTNPTASQYIAILDIAGFEYFEVGKNSFEQLSINFLNEKVREFSTDRLIKEELNYYQMEGLEVPQIEFLDNKNVIEILDHKTKGILSLLEDESKNRIPSNDNYMNRILEACSRKPAFSLPTLKRHDAKESFKNCFIIHHFGKNVCYSSDQFVEKNTESLSPDVCEIIEKSLSGLKISVCQNMNRSKSAVTAMRKNLAALMTSLKENDARFIHCIKPNSEKIPIHFDDNLVSIQLNTFGAAPLVQLMNQGYSATLNYSEISEKIIPYIKYNDKLDLLDMYGYVLNAIGCGSNAYKLGKTQVFFRPKNEHFVNMFCNLNPDESKHIGIIVRKRFCDRQRRAICIALRFISMMRVGLNKKRQIQLEKFDDKENKSCNNIIDSTKTNNNAVNEQNDSMKSSSNNVAVQMDEQKDSRKSNNSSAAVTSQKKPRAKTEKRPPNHIRYSSGNHTTEMGDNRVRCKMEGCIYKSNVKCVICNVHLCVNNRNCFENFHDINRS